MRFSLAHASAAVFGCALAVQAQGVTTYDAALASPNGGTTPGWYNGTGNPNGGFTVSTDNNIEIGLRAKHRQDPNVIDVPGNTYIVQPGISTGTRAWWNYEFSVNTRAGGVGTLTLADITAELTITDPSFGAPVTVNALTYWTDNSGVNAVGKHEPQVGTDWGFQNSENPQFSDYPLFGAGYDVNANRVVQFDLTVKDLSSNVLATDTIFVVVPEPASVGLLMLAGGAFVARRRRSAR